jgi:hypothetical protein
MARRPAAYLTGGALACAVLVAVAASLLTAQPSRPAPSLTTIGAPARGSFLVSAVAGGEATVAAAASRNGSRRTVPPRGTRVESAVALLALGGAALRWRRRLVVPRHRDDEASAAFIACGLRGPPALVA